MGLMDGAGILTTDDVCLAVREAGFVLGPEDISLDPRDERLAVALPGGYMAWFPTNAGGSARLKIERKVLHLLADRCRFAAPKIVYVSPSGFDVRATVPGVHKPWDLYRRIQHDPVLARRIGVSLGEILAEQHTRISEVDVADWLPRRVSWPNSCDWIRGRLPDVVEDRELLRHAEKVLQVYEGLSVDPSDCVLVHSDVGLHNVAVDDATDAVNGIFDYDSAAWADRHHDFRYLVFDFGEDNLLEAALSVYEPIVGRTIDVMRVKLYNAVCAFNYLAFRRGAPPYERSCGRTLDEDLRWANHALAQLDSTRQAAPAMMSARVAGATATPLKCERNR
jgi:hypothetical protein